MSYIPSLVASLDARLDELATEISTLETARATLRTQPLVAPSTADPHSGARPKRPRRPTPHTTKPAPQPRPPVATERGATARTGSKSDSSKPRRRFSPATNRKRRVAPSLSPDQLKRLLADAHSGLSAGAIAEQAGVGYSRVLAQLRDLEAAGTVRRTGSRRTTLWRLITDEDRVAQRTAQLERLISARRGDRTQQRGRARAS